MCERNREPTRQWGYSAGQQGEGFPLMTCMFTLPLMIRVMNVSNLPCTIPLGKDLGATVAQQEQSVLFRFFLKIIIMERSGFRQGIERRG